jgi:serine/threonine-protein kinase HipA
MGATDEHAKNFSVFLRPSGRFQLTPVRCDLGPAECRFKTDALEEFPSCDVVRNQASLRNEASRSSSFLPNRRQAGIGKDVVPSILEELRGETVTAVDRVNAGLPTGFPGRLADSIANGINRRLDILETGEQVETT